MKRLAIAILASVVTATMIPIVETGHETNLVQQEMYMREILETEQTVYIEYHTETDYDEITVYETEVASPTQEAFKYYDVPLTDEEQEVIQTICKEFQIDYSLVLAIGYVESSWNTEAIGDCGSSIGMYQIQPRWWQGLMSEYQVIDLTDLKQGTTICCAILSQLYKEHTYTDVVLSYYNDGADTQKGQAYKERVCDALRNLEEK